MVIQTTSVVRTPLRLYRMIPKFHYIECKGYPLYKGPLEVDEKYERFFPNELENLLWTYYLIPEIYLSKKLTRHNQTVSSEFEKITINSGVFCVSSKMKFFLKTVRCMVF